MIINIAFFDKYMLSDVLLQKIKDINIIEKHLCVSYDVRLRYKRKDVFVYNTSKGKKGIYQVSTTDYSFGCLYKLELEDLDLLDLVLSAPFYHKEVIHVGIIEGTLEEIGNYTFKLIKNTKAICYCCDEDNHEYISRYKRRYSKINISKLILLSEVLKENNEVMLNDDDNRLE